jgi:hypothetical protein
MGVGGNLGIKSRTQATVSFTSAPGSDRSCSRLCKIVRKDIQRHATTLTKRSVRAPKGSGIRLVSTLSEQGGSRISLHDQNNLGKSWYKYSIIRRSNTYQVLQHSTIIRVVREIQIGLDKPNLDKSW